VAFVNQQDTGNGGGNMTQGETHGVEQEPVVAGERDGTQREAEQREPREGDPARAEISSPDELEDPKGASDDFAESPDATYGRHEDQNV
jgi:hypothetical protein